MGQRGLRGSGRLLEPLNPRYRRVSVLVVVRPRRYCVLVGLSRVVLQGLDNDEEGGNRDE